MVDVVIYSADYCPYCQRAKDLLKQKGIEYNEIDVTEDQALRLEAMEKSGGRKTVPQIFINDQHVGGFDDLHALDQEGKLDTMLAS